MIFCHIKVRYNDQFPKAEAEAHNPGFYPITYATFWLEWRAAQGRPWLFHIDNVLLHAGSAVLLLYLCHELTLGPVCWFVAGLWALHPMHVESVAWISERKNVLYVFLYLSALALFLRSQRHDRGRLTGQTAYTLSLVLFAAAILSKPAAITLPAALVLVAWTSNRSLDRRFWGSLIPFAVLSLAGGLYLLRSVPPQLPVPSLATRLTLPPQIGVFYLSKFLWPRHLVPIYPKWTLHSFGLMDGLSWLGLIGAATGLYLVLRHRARLVLFGVAFFIVNLSLVAGLVWNTYFAHSLIADHFAYLPNLGLAIAIGAALIQLRGVVSCSPPIFSSALGVCCALVAGATFWQVPVWHDTETLWRYTLAYNADCATCHYDLGILLAERGDLTGAAEQYEQALRVRPDFEADINFGNVRMAQGRTDEARTLYQAAAELNPGSEKAHCNLGIVLAAQGKLEEAIRHYRKAIELAPRFAEAHIYLGNSLEGTGQLAEAQREFEVGLRIAPGDPDGERGLGRVAAAQGDWESAAVHLERALVHKDASTVHRELAEALEQLERGDEAMLHYQAAYRLNPDSVDVVLDLVAALLRSHRIAQAVNILKQHLAKTQDDASLANSLAWIRATARDSQWRDAAEAVRLAEHACALTGYKDPDMLDTLSAAYAEAGRFDDAVRTAQEALEILRRSQDREDGRPQQAQEVRRRLVLYQGREPYRSPW